MNIEHTTEPGGNIFADLGVPDAENEKLRLTLLMAVRDWVNNSGMTQVEAAKTMGVAQPTLNDAVRFRYKKFTIDRLVRMLAGAGMRVDVVIRDKVA